jgi:glycosyltransferase involved in cell wall biosynthesis
VARDPKTLVLAMATWGDPDDPTASSGWPTSLLAALREVVGEVLAISDAPDRRIGRAAVVAGAVHGARLSDLRSPLAARARLRSSGRSGYPLAVARQQQMRRRLERLDHVDGLVQHGADYPGPPGVGMVTYQDSTVLQALRAYPWRHLQALGARDLDRLAGRQRRSLASAVACCAATGWAAESIAADYGIATGKIHVVGCGPNHDPHVNASEGRDWSRPRFLFIGADWERKNGSAVLTAFARVRERFPDATLDLVGGHPRVTSDGVTAHGLLAMDRAGDRGRISELYRRSTAFVMPSLHEPAGSVYIEAAVAGIASI